MTYTYLKLRDEIAAMKEEHKSIPLLEFENTWYFRLKTCQKFNDLIKEDKITMGKGFYPRLPDTRQAGVRCWKELCRKYFKDTEKEIWDVKFLEVMLKRKRFPVVFFNSICFFDFDKKVDEEINANDLELKFLEWTTDEPQPPKKKEVGETSSKEKMEGLVNIIKTAELTHDETCALVIALISTLNSYPS